MGRLPVGQNRQNGPVAGRDRVPPGRRATDLHLRPRFVPEALDDDDVDVRHLAGDHAGQRRRFTVPRVDAAPAAREEDGGIRPRREVLLRVLPRGVGLVLVPCVLDRTDREASRGERADEPGGEGRLPRLVGTDDVDPRRALPVEQASLPDRCETGDVRGKRGDPGIEALPRVDELPVDRGPREEVYGRDVAAVLVGFRPPTEAGRVEIPQELHETQARLVRAERSLVRDVQLDAAAVLARELVERGAEDVRPEDDARQAQRVRAIRGGLRVEPRRADDLERVRRAARLGEVRPFQEAHPRVDERRLARRHVRRRQDPGGCLSDAVAGGGPPAPRDLHGNDGQVAAERELVVHVACDLPRRHAVAWRDGPESDEREEPFLGKVPFDLESTERVRPVEDDDRQPPRRARPHDERRRPYERVVARADVGEVADDGVEGGEVFRTRGEVLEAFAVERDDGKLPGWRVAVADREHVLDGAREAVLRSEEDTDVETGTEEGAGRRDEARRHRGRVRDEAESAAAQRGRVFEDNVETGEQRCCLHRGGPTESSGAVAAPR